MNYFDMLDFKRPEGTQAVRNGIPYIVKCGKWTIDYSSHLFTQHPGSIRGPINQPVDKSGFPVEIFSNSSNFKTDVTRNGIFNVNYMPEKASKTCTFKRYEPLSPSPSVGYPCLGINDSTYYRYSLPGHSISPAKSYAQPPSDPNNQNIFYPGRFINE